MTRKRAAAPKIETDTDGWLPMPEGFYTPSLACYGCQRPVWGWRYVEKLGGPYYVCRVCGRYYGETARHMRRAGGQLSDFVTTQRVRN